MPGLPTDHDAFARAALPAYGRDPGAPLRLLSVSENATWLVRDERPMVLRVHRPGYHTLRAIESELDWVAALRRDTAVRTPVPIPAADGRRVVGAMVDGRMLLVDAWQVVPGMTLEQTPGVSSVAAVGALMARMHEQAMGWSPPAGFDRFAWDLDDILGPDARWGDWRALGGLGEGDRAAIERALELVVERVGRFGRAGDRYGLVHGDISPANLMVDPAGGLTVLDFDDSGWSWFLFDLACVIASFVDEAEADRVAEGLLRGYADVRPLPREHLAMLPAFVLLRRVHLVAWAASHAEVAADGSPELARATARAAARVLSGPG
ncbi:MAG: phosphotransferase [Chloroflexota bacterium]